jgi:hypothetical protein
MTKQDFLEKKEVYDFISFLISRINHDNSFLHNYITKKPKNGIWECHSIFNSYEKYSWPFICAIPSTGKVERGSSYSESELVLKQLQKDLRNSLINNKEDHFIKNCIAVLDWGGVIPHNKKRILSTSNIIQEFKHSIYLLNNPNLNTNGNFDRIHMNAGYTKIYSLLLDNFIIYDGRVGAALGLLVRLFLEENHYNNIPDSLHFAFGAPKISNSNKQELIKRNPSNSKFKFKALANKSSRHIENNIRANWLLSKVALESKFSHESNPLRSLEAALFMIGYDIRKQ